MQTTSGLYKEQIIRRLSTLEKILRALKYKTLIQLDALQPLLSVLWLLT